jgi:hypothetical protein
MPFTAMLTNSVVWGLYGFGKRDITSASHLLPPPRRAAASSQLWLVR